MAKKLKQGQKYQQGFTQKQILLKLCEKDKTPTTEIFDYLKDCFGIREQKNIRIHLEKLEKEKLIKRESAGLGHVDYWSIITTLSVLKKIVIRLNHDFDSQRKLLASPFYCGLIPELVHDFGNTIPLVNGEIIDFSKEDREHLKESLKDNWLALRFVFYFIAVPQELRYHLFTQIGFDAICITPPRKDDAPDNVMYKMSGFLDVLNYLNSNYRFLFD